VLCVIASKRVHHFEVFYRDLDQKYCTSNGHKFVSLDVSLPVCFSGIHPLRLSFCVL
jgi:hypothetical protein